MMGIFTKVSAGSLFFCLWQSGEGIETEEEGGGRSGLGEVGATWRSQVGLCRGTGRWRRTLRAAKPAAP